MSNTIKIGVSLPKEAQWIHGHQLEIELDADEFTEHERKAMLDLFAEPWRNHELDYVLDLSGHDMPRDADPETWALDTLKELVKADEATDAQSAA